MIILLMNNKVGNKKLLMVWTFVFKDVPYKYDDAYQA